VQSKNLQLTQELYVIRAHLLYWSSLLEDFKRTVNFVIRTLNPAMDADEFTDDDRRTTQYLLTRECNNLLGEVERLDRARNVQEKRLKNAMDLVRCSAHAAFRVLQIHAGVCYR
jgi:hypothetical protein